MKGSLICNFRFAVISSICLFIISFGSQRLEGQTYLDTLRNIWKDETATDTIRAESYFDYIYDYFVLQNPDSASLHIKILYDFCIEHNLSLLAAQTKRMEGYHFFRTGNYLAAITSYDNALEIAEKIRDTLEIGSILLRKGWLYHDNGQKIIAINNYQKSKEFFERLNYQSGLLSVYNELGSIYRDEDQWEKSLDYYRKSLDICKSLNLEGAATLSNIGVLYVVQEKYDSAFVYLFRSLELSEKANDKLGIASDLYTIAMAYSDLEDEKKAIEYYNKSLDISREINDVQRIIACMLDLGYIDLDNENYQFAIDKCRSGLKMAESLNDIDDQLYACDCLYEAYKAQGNGEMALDYFEKAQQFMDSLKIRETTSQILQMEFASKLKSDSLLQIEKDIIVAKEHQAELTIKNRNRNIAIGGTIFFLLLALSLFVRNRLVHSSKRELEKEKARSDSLLLSILPAEIAEELKIKGKIEPRNFEEVSVLFTDFKSFTDQAKSVPSQILMSEINECFEAFDHICAKYHIEKIKSIGDAFMAAGGLPMPSQVAVRNTVLAGLEMQDYIRNRLQSGKHKIPFEMRLGIHTGPITAGIVGVKKFQYDLWGDTVNTASRMESRGKVHKVNISAITYSAIKDDPEFVFQSRGEIEVKGKGKMRMYFVELK